MGALPVGGAVESHDLAGVVDPGRHSEIGVRNRNIDHGEAAVSVEEATELEKPSSCGVLPHDLAGIIYSEGFSSIGTRNIDGDETTGGVEEAVRPGAVSVGTYDLAAVVDPA